MTLPDHLSALAKLHASGRATEQSYRGDLQQLLSSLCPGITVIGESMKKLPTELRIKYPLVDWADMACMRDVLIHHLLRHRPRHRVGLGDKSLRRA
jgi:uncharacterized protein with HEPN domain